MYMCTLLGTYELEHVPVYCYLDLLIRGTLSFQYVKGGDRFTERHAYSYDSRGRSRSSPEQLPCRHASRSLRCLLRCALLAALRRSDRRPVPGLASFFILHLFHAPIATPSFAISILHAASRDPSYRHVSSVRHGTANHRTGDTRDVARSARSELVVQGMSQHHPDVPSALLGRVL